jgi:hypothetical protein
MFSFCSALFCGCRDGALTDYRNKQGESMFVEGQKKSQANTCTSTGAAIMPPDVVDVSSQMRLGMATRDHMQWSDK